MFNPKEKLMSIWTHVAAIIRIDSIKVLGVGPCSKEDIEKVLGPIVTFGSTDEEYGACTLPCGSEGSLKYSVWENEDDSSMAAFTVSIFGDLRNYDETDSIEKWFNEFCEKFPGMIRQAVCLAEVEYGETKVFQYKQDDAE